MSSKGNSKHRAASDISLSALPYNLYFLLLFLSSQQYFSISITIQSCQRNLYIIQIIDKMFHPLLLLLTLLILPSYCTDWQAFGNFTTDGVALIRNTIDTAINRLQHSFLTKTELPGFIAMRLRGEWDSTWNVFVLGSQTPGLEGVVYGQALQDRWFWLNGYPHRTSKLSFILWNSPKCRSPITLSKPTSGRMNPSTAQFLGGYSQNRLQNEPSLFNDPWLFAFGLVGAAAARFEGQSFTAVVHQGVADEYYAWFCGEEEQFMYREAANFGQRLGYLVFRTG